MRVLVFFSWNTASGVASCQGGWATEGLAWHGLQRSRLPLPLWRASKSVSLAVPRAYSGRGRGEPRIALAPYRLLFAVFRRKRACRRHRMLHLFTPHVYLWLRKYLTWCERPLLVISIVECYSNFRPSCFDILWHVLSFFGAVFAVLLDLRVVQYQLMF